MFLAPQCGPSSKRQYNIPFGNEHINRIPISVIRVSPNNGNNTGPPTMSAYKRGSYDKINFLNKLNLHNRCRM